MADLKCFMKTYKLAKPFKEINVKQKVLTTQQIEDRIIIIGSLKRALDHISNEIFLTQGPRSVIITSERGVGKTTLIRLAAQLTQVNTIFIDSCLFCNDLTTIQNILKEGGFKDSLLKETLADTMRALEHDKHKRSKDRLVIVLENFENFCRQNQSLLYNLTQMMQFNLNIGLIGLTSNYDCTENIEKRVRSRLSAAFYHLDMPYSNEDDYIEFTNHLVGYKKLSEGFVNTLKNLYISGDASLTQLKLTLQREFKIDGYKKIIGERKSSNNPLRARYYSTPNNADLLRCLPNLRILVVIFKYCYRYTENQGSIKFKPVDIIARNQEMSLDKKFQKDRLDIPSIGLLVDCNLISLVNNNRIDLESTYELKISYQELQNLGEENEDIKSELTDAGFYDRCFRGN